MLDTNTLIEITQNGAPATVAEMKQILSDPSTLNATIVAWGAFLILVAGTLGRIYHAFRSGAGMTGAVSAMFLGTNTPKGLTTEALTKAVAANTNALMTGDTAQRALLGGPAAPTVGTGGTAKL